MKGSVCFAFALLAIVCNAQLEERFLIDDFTLGLNNRVEIVLTSSMDTGNGDPAVVEEASYFLGCSGNVIGCARDVKVEVYSAVVSDPSSQAVFGAYFAVGFNDYANTSDAKGGSAANILQYDGDDGTAELDIEGLPVEQRDFTDGGHATGLEFFAFSNIPDGLTPMFTVELFDTTGGKCTGTVEYDLHDYDYTDSVYLLYEDMTGECELTSIGAAQFTFPYGDDVFHYVRRISVVGPCRAGSFDDGNGGCSLCSIGCHTCASIAGCTVCRGGFSDVLDDNTCVQCPAGCTACSGTKDNLQCEMCDSGRFKAVKDGSCVLSCPEGEYEISSNGACATCPDGCETCTAAAEGVTDNEGTICFSCKAKADGTETFSEDGKCVEACAADSATFAKAASSVCAPCPHACTKCSALDDCSECEENFVSTSDGKRCVLGCEYGEIEENKRCVACAGDCATCADSKTQCLSCKPSSLKFYNSADQTCVAEAECPSDTYPNTSGAAGEEVRTCAPCSARCTTCSGPGRNQCTVVPPTGG